ncbi:peptidoglycan-binding domain-containing protein [Streptomyces cadmiisoli]|uniref:Peptidoglycan-binding protein n=1 Tax=Streptomyces cadmiisoli TaxID=2184053 RepID=A0A2Z4J8R2_9ACTN|nr:peptidoglycan-binding domain-containing protein [Streptomyces cadmiisoli]AWW41535.1 peptidoglycan-binding protein [Streptomyces cadmiisoli]
MTWHTKRIKLAACTVGALTAAVLAVSATPAAAAGTYSGRAYVYGTGEFDGDWGDEGILQRNTHASSNATCLWQMILWADGELTSKSQVDGVFGDGTYNATRAWQIRENESYDAGLEVDGSVGKGTFGWAQNWLHIESGGEGAGQTLNLSYNGLWGAFDARRLADGTYEFVDGDGSWRKAGYDYRTCR